MKTSIWLMHTRYTEPLSFVLTQEEIVCFSARRGKERRPEQRYTGACVLRPRPHYASMSARRQASFVSPHFSAHVSPLMGLPVERLYH